MPDDAEKPKPKRKLKKSAKGIVPPTPETPKEVENVDPIAYLKSKYRLDKDVNIFAKSAQGARMGKGAVIDENVFSKFAELDPTKDKRYLDWMLYQSGGGAEAFKKSRDNWGDGTPELAPEHFFKKFAEERPNHHISAEEVRVVTEKLKDKGLDFPHLPRVAEQIGDISEIDNPVERWKKMAEMLKATGVAPGREGRVAVEIIGNKFKVWSKQQLGTKTRDRVHATAIYSRIVRGMDRKEAEEKWEEMKDRRRREYVLGDQDALKWDAFGFSRNWPGRHGIYETVYNQMKQFLSNKERVDSYNRRLETYNARVADKNKSVPADKQIPQRKPMGMNMDIGNVLLDNNGNLIYKGNFPTVQKLSEFNSMVSELPMAERIAHDVQYAGPKGSRSRTNKLYSDDNLDVFVPLTVAAAIQAGDEEWEVSDPNQLSQVKSSGAYPMSSWTKHATGQHGNLEWEGTQALSVFFHLKHPSLDIYLERVWLIIYLDDLVDLQPPYVATLWHLAKTPKKITFTQLMAEIKENMGRSPDNKQAYISLVRSMGNAMKTLREWGKEFNPQDVVADYVKHHREKLQGKRTLGEQIKIRASQVLHALLE